MECDARNLLNGPLCSNITANRKRDQAERKRETRNSITPVMGSTVMENTDNKDTDKDRPFSVNANWNRNTWLRNLLLEFVLGAWTKIMTQPLQRTSLRGRERFHYNTHSGTTKFPSHNRRPQCKEWGWDKCPARAGLWHASRSRNRRVWQIR